MHSLLKGRFTTPQTLEECYNISKTFNLQEEAAEDWVDVVVVVCVGGGVIVKAQSKKIASLSQNSALFVCKPGKLAYFHRALLILPTPGEK